MRNGSRRYTTDRRNKKDEKFVVKTFVQTVIALGLLLVVWGFSVSEQPTVRAWCDKIKHYLTYTVDVRSVFQPITENNAVGVNENVH